MAWIAMTNEDGTKSLIHSDLCDDYLAHHGVKGQKWGVRRYQNKSGTKKHKRISSKKSGKQRKANSKIAKKSGKQRKANSKIAKRSKPHKDRGVLDWHLLREMQDNLQRIQNQMMEDQMRQQQEQNQIIQQQNQMIQDQIWQQQQIDDPFPMFF